MITVKTNIGSVIGKVREKIDKLKDKEYLLRPVCFDVIELMTDRIHKRGEASSGSQIGNYSSEYLRLRQRKYSRSADKKIIVSLTRQLENDWSVIATDRGYGVGFLNAFNEQKARWVEQNKGVKIFSLSPSETAHVQLRIGELVRQALND